MFSWELKWNKEYYSITTIYFSRLSSIIYQRIFSAFKRSDVIFKLTKYGRQHEELVRYVHDFAMSVIEDRRQVLLKRKADGLENETELNEYGMKKKKALLDQLLQSTVDGKPLSNEDIREEVDNFMFAVSWTTLSGHLKTFSSLSI